MKKNEKLLKSINFIDDKYVEEAAGNRPAKKRSLMRIAALAACACFVITVANLWLFTPYNTTPDDVSCYSDSEYYPIIEKINLYNFVKPRYKNNMEMLIASVSDFFGSFFLASKGDAAGGDGVPEVDFGPGDYVEVTDNQVSGVVEADIIKRTTTHIFRLYDGVLSAYSIAGDSSAIVGALSLRNHSSLAHRYTGDWEFFLSADATTVTVIATGADSERKSAISLISIDVTDPANMTEKGSVTLDGSYVSSRLVDGELLMMSEFYFPRQGLDFSIPETFVPGVTTEGGKELIPIDSIVSPDTVTTNRYTVITKFDGASLELLGSGAFLSYSDTVYVSDSAIYAARQFTESTTDGIYRRTEAKTEISGLSYTGADFEYEGSIIISGTVKDQYSLDEHDGMLRVAASINRYSYREYAVGDSVGAYHSESTVNSSLYIIDLDSWELAASVDCFAPAGDTVRSARFDGAEAYICTSIVLTDPVYIFDLSDIENITEKNTGIISGYSSSLINFGDFLLGIGLSDSWGSLKIEVYEEGETTVDSVDAYIKQDVDFSERYKAYYVDRENMLIGLAYYDYSSYEAPERYVLLHFDGYELRELLNVSLEGNFDYVRGVYIDGYMYLFGDSFKPVRVN